MTTDETAIPDAYRLVPDDLYLRMVALIAAMSDPNTVYQDRWERFGGGYERECIYCENSKDSYRAPSRALRPHVELDGIRHEPDCLLVRARAILAELDAGDGAGGAGDDPRA